MRSGVAITPPLFIEEGDRRPNKNGVRWRSSVGLFAFFNSFTTRPQVVWGGGPLPL